ncbi:uncharacterized protein B0I36DRAFT_83474 [Microdochium trichocladiopsis]|uniref:Uncharacterized protein n=1 Tax=Microdochium trichocladiopsis TaxID=1682393 RepID=A0A9P8YD93_9PEZI|nr:uncharacterized protein B0I36DRAFT_83474 [Microdochium trichocladiopsis]KAH7034722.1 hypothetical protein B0I36DRAFT_83474 [Microdochium trichocladiopsis]
MIRISLHGAAAREPMQPESYAPTRKKEEVEEPRRTGRKCSDSQVSPAALAKHRQCQVVSTNIEQFSGLHMLEVSLTYSSRASRVTPLSLDEPSLQEAGRSVTGDIEFDSPLAESLSQCEKFPADTQSRFVGLWTVLSKDPMSILCDISAIAH